MFLKISKYSAKSDYLNSRTMKTDVADPCNMAIMHIMGVKKLINTNLIKGVLVSDIWG